MLGSLLCRKWHGWLTRLGLSASRNEFPGWHLQKVWTGGQRRQFIYNEIPDRHITGWDVGVGHGAELHGGGRLVPSDTPTADIMPGVWSWDHHGVHDRTPLPHAWYWACYRLELAAGQPDSTPIPGIRCDLPAVNEAMTLPLPRMPGVLPHVEFLVLLL